VHLSYQVGEQLNKSFLDQIGQEPNLELLRLY